MVGAKENGLVYRRTGGDGWGSEGWWMEAGAASGQSRGRKTATVSRRMEKELCLPLARSHTGRGVPEKGAGVPT